MNHPGAAYQQGSDGFGSVTISNTGSAVPFINGDSVLSRTEGTTSCYVDPGKWAGIFAGKQS